MGIGTRGTRLAVLLAAIALLAGGCSTGVPASDGPSATPEAAPTVVAFGADDLDALMPPAAVVGHALDRALDGGPVEPWFPLHTRYLVETALPCQLLSDAWESFQPGGGRTAEWSDDTHVLLTQFANAAAADRVMQAYADAGDECATFQPPTGDLDNLGATFVLGETGDEGTATWSTGLITSNAGGTEPRALAIVSLANVVMRLDLPNSDGAAALSDAELVAPALAAWLVDAAAARAAGEPPPEPPTQPTPTAAATEVVVVGKVELDVPSDWTVTVVDADEQIDAVTHFFQYATELTSPNGSVVIRVANSNGGVGCSDDVATILLDRRAGAPGFPGTEVVTYIHDYDDSSVGGTALIVDPERNCLSSANTMGDIANLWVSVSSVAQDATEAELQQWIASDDYELVTTILQSTRPTT